MAAQAVDGAVTSPTDDPFTELRSSASQVHDLVKRYVKQIRHGCGNPQCRQLLCEDGRQNAKGKPTRRYTARSARTVALALASGPRPTSRLCAEVIQPSEPLVPEIKPCRIAPEVCLGEALGEARRDPTSVAQLLADSGSLKHDGHAHEADTQHTWTSNNLDVLQDGHRSLDVAAELQRNWTRGVDVKVQDETIRALQCLFATIRGFEATYKRHPGNESLIDRRVQSGYAHLPARPSATTAERGVSSLELKQIALLFDTMAASPQLRLLRRCVSICSPGQLGFRVMFDAASIDRLIMCIWLRMLFLREWNQACIMRSDSIPHRCLVLLEGLKPLWGRETKDSGRWLESMAVVVSTVEPLELAQLWLHQFNHAAESAHQQHLLDFPWLFPSAKLTFYFRLVNHLRIQHAHNRAERAAMLRTKSAPGSHDASEDARICALENHYLLLSVSRINVLRDSMDQVWQRKSNELLRPLRVRLGEMDAFEVGHDLGGVQIEYFNLLCKEVLDEDLGMFTSDPQTGLSYFRAGSLQPLYMFELFGLLLALAIHNGITLPVSFPLALYMQVLDIRPRGLDIIKDGWPAVHRSLTAVIDDNVTGLDWSFPLEANGVRLSIASVLVEPERESPKRTARVLEASAISGQNDSEGNTESGRASSASVPAGRPIDLSTIDWPGWSFEWAQPDDRPFTEVKTADKEEFVDLYVDFITSDCVGPQKDHFVKGFQRILPADLLSYFWRRPEILQRITEGTRHLSIPDLRSVTLYEDYDPTGEYIQTFWSIVSAWPQTKQLHLLKFVTAAERLPVNGAKGVTFRISRAVFHEAEESLPTSSTCFGVLHLPEYPSGEVLERKLTVALEMGGVGFGMG